MSDEVSGDVMVYVFYDISAMHISDAWKFAVRSVRHEKPPKVEAPRILNKRSIIWEMLVIFHYLMSCIVNTITRIRSFFLHPPSSTPRSSQFFYSGMCLKGWARLSWQKGSLLTVQISVSYNVTSPVSLGLGIICPLQLTYRLQVLLDLSVQSTSLQSDDLGGSIGVVGNGRATLGAEDTVDGMARRSLAGPSLGGAVDSQSGLGDDSDQSYSDVSH